jgi:thiol-disulfide isomerase/thioredoxin
MKKTFLLSILSVLLWQCGSHPKQITYKVKGQIQGFDKKKAYLSTFDKALKPVSLDTVIVSDSVFEFKVPQQNPNIAIISFEKSPYRLPVIIGDGDIDLIADTANPFKSDLSKTTSPLTHQFYAYQRQAMKDQKKGMELMKSYKMAQSKAKRDSIKQAFEQWQKNIETDQYEYISKHKDYVGLIIMQSLLGSTEAKFEKIKKAFESYPLQVKNSNLGKYINTTLLTKGATEIGGKAPNFVGTTPKGKKLSLNQAMGKVTIIDFWASWCRPCRAENPYVVEIYNKYHDQGLNIIGVSLDKTKEAWLKAIEDDGLKWQHVSELKFWQDPIAKKYGVMSIPQTFILDAKGIIRAKNLRRQDLENKIKELVEE